jgi:hypothetical protein
MQLRLRHPPSKLKNSIRFLRFYSENETITQLKSLRGAKRSLFHEGVKDRKRGITGYINPGCSACIKSRALWGA